MKNNERRVAHFKRAGTKAYVTSQKLHSTPGGRPPKPKTLATVYNLKGHFTKEDIQNIAAYITVAPGAPCVPGVTIADGHIVNPLASALLNVVKVTKNG